METGDFKMIVEEFLDFITDKAWAEYAKATIMTERIKAERQREYFDFLDKKKVVRL